jgi:peptidyl-prolyl cis-trans isomerase D
MRRNVILAAVLTTGLLGCNSFRDMFSAHADVAAEAASQQLPAQRLAQILSSGGKGVRINHETADYVANVWVDYALFGQAVVHGKLPLDSASVADAVWPELSELKGNHWHDTLMAHRTVVSDAAVDSLYSASDTRVLQHILFSARPNIDSAARKTIRSKAEATLAQINKGASFDQLAAQLSEDPGSKADSGYLPPSPKGRFVPAFDSVGWSLQPGQVSGVVQTPFGYHIIKRPTLTEAHDHIVDFLQDKVGRRIDSLYMDSLAQANKIQVVADAPAAMRAAAEASDQSKNSSKTLAKYTGGELTVKDYLRWVRALPPQYMQQLREANDSTLKRFARILTQNVLLLREADRNKIAITPLEWSSLKHRYEEQIDTLRTEMGLQDGDITDSGVAIGEREKVAGLKVERYFDELMAGKTRLRPLPSALSTLLRERMPYDVHEAGVNRSVELATEIKAKADSAAPKGPMQRAPGGPPVPGIEPAPGGAPSQGATTAPSAHPAPQAGSPAPAPATSGATHP